MHQMAYISTCLFQIQLVGFNAKLYPNLTVASSKNHGIVVVSVLVQVSPKLATTSHANILSKFCQLQSYNV